MARYKKYTIVHNDTLQSIAQQEMGDMSAWEEIVDYNRLVYPFITDNLQEKLQNPEGLVTEGDTIIIPIEVDLLDTDSDSLGQRDKDLIMGLALGRDLKLAYIEESVANKGNFGETLGLVADNRGDIQVVQGVDNLRQATITRLLTPKGSLLGHPKYGSDFHNILGSRNTYETLIMLEDEIVSTLKMDSRIDEVAVVNSSIENETYQGEFQVTLRTFQEYFNLVIEADQSGSLLIT